MALTITPHPDRVAITATDSRIVNGEIVVDRAGLGKLLLIVDEAGQCVGSVRLDVPPPPRRNKDAENCIHRGEETRQAECKSCAGSVSLKVFRCGWGGECHLSKKTIEGARSCVSCGDFKAGDK